VPVKHGVHATDILHHRPALHRAAFATCIRTVHTLKMAHMPRMGLHESSLTPEEKNEKKNHLIIKVQRLQRAAAPTQTHKNNFVVHSYLLLPPKVNCVDPPNMAEAVAVAPQPAPQQGTSIWQMLLQFFVMYQVVQWFTGGSRAPQASAPAIDPGTGRAILPHRNIWPDHAVFDVFVYASEFEDFSEIADKKDALIWHETRLAYNWDAGNERAANLTIPVSLHMLNNGSIWGHIFMARTGYPHGMG
jgi:hypothetical protein